MMKHGLMSMLFSSYIWRFQKPRLALAVWIAASFSICSSAAYPDQLLRRLSF